METDAFLNRIAGALKRPRLVSAPPRPVKGVPEFHRVADPDPAVRFKAELESLGGRVFIEPDGGAASARLRAVFAELAPKSFAAWAPEHFGGVDLAWLWKTPTAPPLDADVGVTSADFAVAETGTLVLAAGPGRPRLASLAPAAHVALVPRSRLVARLGDAIGRLVNETPPSGTLAGLPPASAVQCITGPSRTADIENDLAIGVHGPASVTVILWGEPDA